jgi:hypothetical protein
MNEALRIPYAGTEIDSKERTTICWYGRAKNRTPHSSTIKVKYEIPRFAQDDIQKSKLKVVTVF